MIIEIIRAHEWVRTMVTSVRECVLLPVRSRRRRLFLELFNLSGVLSAALYLCKCMALATDDVTAADLYLIPRDMHILGVFQSNFVAEWLRSGHLPLFPLAYLVAGIGVGSVTYIATIFAAVMACNDCEQEEEKEEEEDVGEQQEDEDEEQEDEEEEDEEEQEEKENEEEEEKEEEEQKQCTLLSFLGTVKSNLARPAKIICLSCVVRVALFLLLAQLGNGTLDRSQVIYPAVLIYFLLQFVFEVAVVASVAEEQTGESAVRRACRVMRGKYKELLFFLMGWGTIHDVFSVVCALVVKVGLPHQVDAAVMCLLLGAKQLFSVANLTGYYFACRKKENQKQARACHLD